MTGVFLTAQCHSAFRQHVVARATFIKASHLASMTNGQTISQFPNPSSGGQFAFGVQGTASPGSCTTNINTNTNSSQEEKATHSESTRAERIATATVLSGRTNTDTNTFAEPSADKQSLASPTAAQTGAGRVRSTSLGRSFARTGTSLRTKVSNSFMRQRAASRTGPAWTTRGAGGGGDREEGDEGERGIEGGERDQNSTASVALGTTTPLAESSVTSVDSTHAIIKARGIARPVGGSLSSGPHAQNISSKAALLPEDKEQGRREGSVASSKIPARTRSSILKSAAAYLRLNTSNARGYQVGIFVM